MKKLEKLWGKIKPTIKKTHVTVYPSLKSSVYLIDDREWDKWLTALSQHPEVDVAYETSGQTVKALTLEEFLTWERQGFYNFIMRGRTLYCARLIDIRILPLLSPEEASMVMQNSEAGKWFAQDTLPERKPYATPLPQNGQWVDAYTIRLFLIAASLKERGVTIGTEVWPILSNEELLRLETKENLPVFPDSGDYLQWLRSNPVEEIDLYHP